MSIYNMHGINAIQLTQDSIKADVDKFISVWYEWRTYGLVMKNLTGEEVVEWGDWIVKFPDGTFAGVSNKIWDRYVMNLGKCFLKGKPVT